MGTSASCCHEEKGVPAEKICAQTANPGEQLQGNLYEQGLPPAQEPSPCQQLPRIVEDKAVSMDTTHEGSPPKEENSTATKHVGLVKMQSLSQLEVDQDILRSISLRGTLQRGGKLWRKSPLDLPEEARSALWEKSRPTTFLHVFLSHTWRTSGRWKVIALFLQAGWKHLLLSWVAVQAFIILLYADALPRAFPSITGRSLDREFQCHVGGFGLALYPLAIFLGHLVTAYLPERRSTQSFLDVVCIHQVDQKLMLRGIYGLGGFLARSEELRVLWSPPYFSRKWCVFEMAAYRAANPSGRIRMAPLFLEVTMVALGTCVYFTTWLMFGAAAVKSPLNALFPFPIGPVALLPMLAAAHTLRRLIAEKQTLVDELANFDVDKADCRLEFDNTFVNNAIEAWYGSREAFNQYVRGPLRKELLAGATQVPVGYFLLICTITMIPGNEVNVGMWLDGVPSDMLWARVLGWTFGFGIGSQLVTLKLLVYLCDRFASPKLGTSCVCDYMQTVLIFLAFMICDLGSYTVSRQALQHSLWACAAYAVVMSCIAGICHRRSFCQSLN